MAVLANGDQIRARTIVLATGGLFLPDDLKGILRPCWSYFTYLKASPNSFPQPQPHSPNFFTYDFSHDCTVAARVDRTDSRAQGASPTARCASLARTTSRA